MPSDEDKIIESLKNKKWDFRTAEGIARETGLLLEFVKEYMDTHKDIIWKSDIPDRLGRELYSLLERQPQKKDILRSITTFITKSSS